MKKNRLPFLPVVLALSGCCQLSQDDLNKVTAAATSAGEKLVQEGARGKHGISGKNVALAALSGASLGLRTLQGTNAAADPAVVKQTVKDSSGIANAVADTVAPVVANAIAEAVQKGVCKNKANEAAAAGLDAAAAK